MASPRIIAGSAKGIRLKSVPGDSTRPITDRVKEAVFNILSADIIDTNFLDVFGGTGSVGLEALSRGARKAVFVEKNRQAYSVLRDNIKKCRFAERSDLIQGDAFHYLQQPAHGPFEYIYIAPPQYKKMWEEAMHLVDSNLSILSDDGWVIVQIHPIENVDLQLNSLELFDTRTYGSTLLLFYQRKLD